MSRRHAAENDATGSPQVRLLRLAAVPSWIASVLLHVIALLIFALITIRIDARKFEQEIVVGTTDEEMADIFAYLTVTDDEQASN